MAAISRLMLDGQRLSYKRCAVHSIVGAEQITEACGSTHLCIPASLSLGTPHDWLHATVVYAAINDTALCD